MSILVTTDKRDDPDDLLQAIRDLGIEARRIGQGRVLVVDCETPDDFPLKGDPRVWAVEDIRDDYTTLGAVARDSFSLPENLTPARGNWSIARIIRRDPPWDWRNHRAPFATFYEAGLDGAGVDIYILDTGVRVNHVEFGGRASIAYEPSATANGDVRGHGTGCASMAAGASCGLARGASILSFKTMEDDGGGNTLNMTAGMQAALDHYLSTGQVALNRPAIVNMSFGSLTITAAHRDIIAQMIDVGMVVVAAAGNSIKALGTDSGEEPIYPALFPDVIAAGGSNVHDQPYDTSNGFGTNFGSNVDIVAGAQTLRIGYGDVAGDDARFGLLNGTSFAAPAVCGVIACLLTGRPRLTSRIQVQQMLWYLRSVATQGRLLTSRARVTSLPDRLLYLDPKRTTGLDLSTVAFDPAYTPVTPTTLENPSFETGTANNNSAIPGWTERTFSFSDSIQIINNAPADGTKCVTFARDFHQSNASSVYIENTTDVSLPATKAQIASGGTETLTVTIAARANALTDFPGQVRAILRFFDETGEFVSEWVGDYRDMPVQSMAWSDQVWGPIPVPAMARRFKIRIWGRGNAGSQWIRVDVDNVRFAYGSDA